MTLPAWITTPPAMEPWRPRASTDAARLDAMAAALRAHYTGATVRVTVSPPVAEVSIARDGRGWLTTRIHGATLGDSLDEMERVVRGLTAK